MQVRLGLCFLPGYISGTCSGLGLGVRSSLFRDECATKRRTRGVVRRCYQVKLRTGFGYFLRSFTSFGQRSLDSAEPPGISSAGTRHSLVMATQSLLLQCVELTYPIFAPILRVTGGLATLPLPQLLTVRINLLEHHVGGQAREHVQSKKSDQNLHTSSNF